MKIRFHDKTKKIAIYTDYFKKDLAEKTLPGVWHGTYRCWLLEFTYDNYVKIHNLKKSMPEIYVAQNIIDYFKDKKPLDVSGLKTEPMKHQTKLAKLAIDKIRTFFLCDVGVGKTKPAIDAMTLSGVKKILVICPAKTMPNFALEVQKHSNSSSLRIEGTVPKRIKLLELESNYYIVNYAILHKLRRELIEKQFEAIIIDEIHFVKNWKSTRSKALYDIVTGTIEKRKKILNRFQIHREILGKAIPMRIGLTGTLIANNYEDAFMPYKIVDQSIFGIDYYKFQFKYIIMGGYHIKMKNGKKKPTQVIGYKNEDEFQRKLGVNSLKYELDDVVDIPPVIEITKIFELPSKIRAKYQLLKEEALYEVNNEVRVLTVLDKLIKMSELTSGFLVRDDFVGKKEVKIKIDVDDSKLKMLEVELSGISGKVIVWCRFKHSIKKVSELCKKMDLSYLVYDGDTKEKDLYEKFNNDDTKVWVSQIQTGIGYSIPNAKHAIFYELDFDRTSLVQSKGRNRRAKGSEKGSCVYIYLMAKDTVDEHIYKVLKEKNFDATEALKFVKS